MTQPLDEAYFTWLYSHVASVKQKNRSSTYWGLLRHLYTKEFVWFIPNDDNRVEDGKDLRTEFFQTTEVHADHEWRELPCSVLEMLIAFSRRLAFDGGGTPDEWFWLMMENMGLLFYSDNEYHPAEVEDILERFISRTYQFDGSEGGAFPLMHAFEDQREVELWYQYHAYILERL